MEVWGLRSQRRPPWRTGAPRSPRSPLCQPRRHPCSLPSRSSSRGSRSSGLELLRLSVLTSRPGSGSVHSSSRQPERQVLSPGPFRRQVGTLRHGEGNAARSRWWGLQLGREPSPHTPAGCTEQTWGGVDGGAPGNRAPRDRTLCLPLLLSILLGPPPKCTTLTKAKPNSADTEGAILPRAAAPGAGPSHRHMHTCFTGHTQSLQGAGRLLRVCLRCQGAL